MRKIYLLTFNPIHINISNFNIDVHRVRVSHKHEKYNVLYYMYDQITAPNFYKRNS
jgi:hypothetical protein